MKLSLTRLTLALSSLIFAFWCLFLVSHYAELHILSETIAEETTACRSPRSGPSVPFKKYSQALVVLSIQLPEEAEIPYLQASLGLHQLQIASVDGDLGEFDNLKAFIMRIQELQPAHYQAFSLSMANASLSDQPVTDYLNLLRTWLPLAPNEEEVQINAGSYLIAHWTELPEEIKELALPVIQSGLRQQPVKRILIRVMETHNVALPFLKISPDRATTEKLKNIAGFGEAQQ